MTMLQTTQSPCTTKNNSEETSIDQINPFLYRNKKYKFKLFQESRKDFLCIYKSCPEICVGTLQIKGKYSFSQGFMSILAPFQTLQCLLNTLILATR